ncbi:hypothetical protein CC1G_02619 [Coprinopsis cinerea okayama7|uniref:Uncharacterized protein n=1 Tax=Coprinopsis cinerea (strain Okayama-7 / 130 / ATCC MYA-4618 / FGSC 9003) TaxID=240176 RepID=A8PBD4_COPC7|nr:hypothetical protein CC1G_02619 [Coprinopsis cinerea okayama7\|eukprot:XP_001840156.2 hypothetical protein CC1G_02619 [Coprinopsis cinerea okayama7\
MSNFSSSPTPDRYVQNAINAVLDVASGQLRQHLTRLYVVSSIFHFALPPRRGPVCPRIEYLHFRDNQGPVAARFRSLTPIGQDLVFRHVCEKLREKYYANAVALQASFPNVDSAWNDITEKVDSGSGQAAHIRVSSCPP